VYCIYNFTHKPLLAIFKTEDVQISEIDFLVKQFDDGFVTT